MILAVPDVVLGTVSEQLVPVMKPGAILLTEALHETVHTVGVPEKAARAMLLGHTQVAPANTLKGSNPFSDACLIAMDYGRESIVRDDWKNVFEDDELDKVITRMLKIKEIRR